MLSGPCTSRQQGHIREEGRQHLNGCRKHSASCSATFTSSITPAQPAPSLSCCACSEAVYHTLWQDPASEGPAHQYRHQKLSSRTSGRRLRNALKHWYPGYTKPMAKLQRRKTIQAIEAVLAQE